MKQNNSFDNNTILLFDSSMNFQDIQTIVVEEKPKIITFDYESHNLLKKKKISHEISETYVSQSDLEYIQEKSYFFANWYEQSEISHLLHYDGINLGELFFNDFHFELVPILKKFIETKKLFELNKNSKYFASNHLFEIINSFTTKTNKLISKNKTPEIFENAIKLPIKLGKFSFSIKIKYHYLKKLNKIFEKFFLYFLSHKKSSLKIKNNVLLIDFTTKKYNQIFKILPKYSTNLVKFDRIVPAIWNFESFSIIKKSNCIVENYESLIDTNLKNKIKTGIIQLKKNIDLLWQDEHYHESFFTLDGKSFWNLIKPILIKQFNQKSLDAIQEIELTKKLFDKHNFNSILIWSETMINHLIALKIAKKQNIPIHLIQHGLYYDNDAAIKIHKFGRTIPYYADKFFVWGSILKQYATKIGYPENKIKIIGSPIHDSVYLMKNNILKSDDFILLATSSPSQNIATEFTVENLEKYLESIKKICTVSSKLGKKLVIKQHPQAYDLEITEIAKKIDPKITVIKAGDITPLIKKCEVFITMDLSTTMLEAQIFEKPVISLILRDHTMTSEIIKSNSCVSTTIETFETNLNRVITDKKFNQQIIRRGTEFVTKYIWNLGNASQTLLDFIENPDDINKNNSNQKT